LRDCEPQKNGYQPDTEQKNNHPMKSYHDAFSFSGQYIANPGGQTKLADEEKGTG
jgi:hypothetical protein